MKNVVVRDGVEVLSGSLGVAPSTIQNKHAVKVRR